MTSSTKTTYHPNGNIASKLHFFENGNIASKLHFFENGNTKCEVNYNVDGQWQRYTNFWQNGNKQHEAVNSLNRHSETLYWWYENGEECFIPAEEIEKCKTNMTRIYNELMERDIATKHSEMSKEDLVIKIDTEKHCVSDEQI